MSERALWVGMLAGYAGCVMLFWALLIACRRLMQAQRVFDWLTQKRKNARATVAAVEADLAKDTLAVERQGLVIALARARHTEDLCTAALEQRPQED